MHLEMDGAGRGVPGASSIWKGQGSGPPQSHGEERGRNTLTYGFWPPRSCKERVCVALRHSCRWDMLTCGSHSCVQVKTSCKDQRPLLLSLCHSAKEKAEAQRGWDICSGHTASGSGWTRTQAVAFTASDSHRSEAFSFFDGCAGLCFLVPEAPSLKPAPLALWGTYLPL